MRAPITSRYSLATSCSARSRARSRTRPFGAFACDNKKCYVVIMVRTQISLTEKEYAAAKREARRLGISLAELLRRSLRSVLRFDESKPWMRYAGMVESGDPNSSGNIDEVVYGHKD